MNSSPVKDLVVLTADRNTQFALYGILGRHRALGIRPVNPDYYVHPEKDPGVYHNAHDFLRASLRTHTRALVLMDRMGSGQEDKSREVLEARLEDRLKASGWSDDRAAAVVVDPELEAWVWSNSPHVDRELGWSSEPQALRDWLRDRGFLEEGAWKPAKPKEAMEQALRAVRVPRSSAIYQALAERVTLSRCKDSAFAKLRQTLIDWFPDR